MPRYVIIGTGVAGIAAAEAIRNQDESGEILLIGNEPHGYYSRPGLAYLITNEIPESQLYPYEKSDLQRLKSRWLQTKITKIHPQEQFIETGEGKHIRFDKLLLAPGAFAAVPKIPGINLQGVVKLDDLNDARIIIKRTRKARRAVVVGGGITALEIVEGLRARGVKTHYLLRRDRFWGSVLDETESKIVEQRLVKEGVKIHYNSEVEQIIGKGNKVHAVRKTDGSLIKCGIFAFAIGTRPRKHLAETAGIHTDRGILVNEFLQTNNANIFAAGDVAQVFDPFSGETILDSLWGPARMQGQAAGFNMTGQSTPYHKGIPYNVTRLAGRTTTIVGAGGGGEVDDLESIARGESETWRRIPDEIASQSNFDVNRIRLMVAKDKLVGAIVMGDQTLSQYLQHIVSQEVDISPIREQLLQPNAPIADLICNFWIPRREQYAVRGA